MAQKKGRKVVPYRHPKNINVGMIMFALIFVYMSFSVYAYQKREKIQFYEVVDGSIVNDREYTGIIFRDETVKYADHAGYINYYVREGKRASVGTSIYSIDETGRLTAYLKEHPEVNKSLTDENAEDLKKQLSSYSTAYTDEQFHQVYDVKYSLEAAVLEYANFNALEGIDAALAADGISFQQVRADSAGVVSYAIDSFEDLEPSQVTEASFDRSAYARSITKSGQQVESKTPVYKMVLSDNWSVVFPMTEEDVGQFGSEKSLKVDFQGYDLTTTGQFSMITGADGKAYGKLDFDKYMVQFISDRFVTFEIIREQQNGLKIPISAVTTKNFYLVPSRFLAKGGDSSESGFLKETYSEQGTSVVFVPADIYMEKDDFYYIDTADESFKPGDYVVMQDTGERYQIGTSDSLEGVYNINKGYTVFRRIEVLTSNDEYYTIKRGTSYGLSVYDHIVLDASTVEEGKLIYQ